MNVLVCPLPSLTLSFDISITRTTPAAVWLLLPDRHCHCHWLSLLAAVNKHTPNLYSLRQCPQCSTYNIYCILRFLASSTFSAARFSAAKSCWMPVDWLAIFDVAWRSVSYDRNCLLVDHFRSNNNLLNDLYNYIGNCKVFICHYYYHYYIHLYAQCDAI